MTDHAIPIACIACVIIEMARCKLCGKSIKWLEVIAPCGGRLVWKKFDKRRRVGDPFRAHECPKENKVSEPVRKPWWVD
jgi:hypothetical protein